MSEVLLCSTTLSSKVNLHDAINPDATPDRFTASTSFAFSCPGHFFYESSPSLEPGNLSKQETPFCARTRREHLQGFGIFVLTPRSKFMWASTMLRGRSGAMNPFFLFFTLVAGPRRSSSLKLSDTRVYEAHVRARLRTNAHLCKVGAINTKCLAKAAYRSVLSYLILAFPTTRLCYTR